MARRPLVFVEGALYRVYNRSARGEGALDDLEEAIGFVEQFREVKECEVSRLASKRQDSSTGRLRRMVASCGIERWGQRAGRLARVLCKHPVVVSRWVSEGNRLREDDQEFSAELEALDRALSVKALARPRTHRRSTTNRSVNPRIQRAGDQES